MRLPSLRQVTGAAVNTFRRFPFALIDALVGTAALVMVIDGAGEKTQVWWALNNVFLASTLGIALFTTVVLAGERSRWPASRVLLAQCIAALILVLYWLTLPERVYEPPYSYVIRHWLLLAGVHLLAAFAPYARGGEVNGFWQYNKSMFLRFVTAVLFSMVLWAGLAIALAAVDNLFSMHIRGERYSQLWVIITGIFNTWFFLSGVPEKLDELDRETAYPKGLKVFAQYVLLPLVVVYVLILYAYLVKIVIDWDWPKGWVANLVLGFSITGLFSLLLFYPIRDRAENVWIKRFSRYFYLAEIPLVIVLLLAAWRRVTEYGITENRYFVIILGFWLAASVLYFLTSKSASIKVIPASLCILAFLISFGPWGAFQVSERNQTQRLERMLTDAGILQQGKVVRATKGVGFEKAREISSVVRYLSQVHGVSVLQPWFETRLDTIAAAAGQDARTAVGEQKEKAIVQLMGIEYVQEWQGKEEANVHRFMAKKDRLLEITGYNRMLRTVALGESEPTAKSFALPDGEVRLGLSNSFLTVALSPVGGTGDSAALPLAPLAVRLLREYSNPYEIPVEALVLEGFGGTMRVRACLTLLVVRAEGDSTSIQRIESDVLIGPR